MPIAPYHISHPITSAILSHLSLTKEQASWKREIQRRTHLKQATFRKVLSPKAISSATPRCRSWQRKPSSQQRPSPQRQETLHPDGSSPSPLCREDERAIGRDSRDRDPNRHQVRQPPIDQENGHRREGIIGQGVHHQSRRAL